MQNPNEDTEWNDILRSKGILPQKEKEISEEDVIKLVEKTVSEKGQIDGKRGLDELNLDELDELEDEEDERVILEYRKKRIAEIRALAERGKYGALMEISGQDYVQEVNKAGDDVWVVLHLYKTGIPLCTLLNQHLSRLATKFPAVKFLKSISTTCIPNFPDKNLPSIFIYYEGDLKKQIVGPFEFRGMNLTIEELEYMLGQAGAIITEIKEDPRPKVKDILSSKLGINEDDGNDW